MAAITVDIEFDVENEVVTNENEVVTNENEVLTNENEDAKEDKKEDNEEIPTGVGCVNGCLRDTHMVVSVLSITVLVVGIMKLLCHFSAMCASSFFGDSMWFWILFGTVSFLFVFDTIKSNTFEYLRNINTTESVIEYVDRMHRTQPEVFWSIQCYHYETRYRTVTRTDSNGRSYTTTESYQERVNTHSAKGQLNYVRWEDKSVDLDRDEIMEYQMTKVSMKKMWIGDSGCKEQKKNFIARNNRDVYYDFSEELAIKGFLPRLLALVDIEKKPCLAHWMWFLLSHATIVLATPYRMWMSSVTGKVRNTIVKEMWSS